MTGRCNRHARIVASTTVSCKYSMIGEPCIDIKSVPDLSECRVRSGRVPFGIFQTFNAGISMHGDRHEMFDFDTTNGC
jgi:hypothetical protein